MTPESGEVMIDVHEDIDAVHHRPHFQRGHSEMSGEFFIQVQVYED